MSNINISKTGKILLLLIVIISIFLVGCEKKPDDISPLSQIPLESVLINGKPTLAELGWRECIPCKTMRPILEQLAQEYEGTLNVVIVDLPLREDLADKYGIKVMPVQIIFDEKGNEVVRHAGAIPKEAIVEQLSKMGILTN